MNAGQKKMIDNLLAGPRGGAEGPFNVLLRSPEMGDLAGTFGAATRFNTSMPRKLNEMAIILVGRHWTSQFEWAAHHRAALQAGLSPAICDAIAEGKRPPSMAKDEEVVYNFVTELLNTTQMSDATFNATKAMFGERGIVDLVGVMGWYHTVSMLLNVDRALAARRTEAGAQAAQIGFGLQASAGKVAVSCAPDTRQESAPGTTYISVSRVKLASPEIDRSTTSSWPPDAGVRLNDLQRPLLPTQA